MHVYERFWSCFVYVEFSIASCARYALWHSGIQQIWNGVPISVLAFECLGFPFVFLVCVVSLRCCLRGCVTVAVLLVVVLALKLCECQVVVWCCSRVFVVLVVPAVMSRISLETDALCSSLNAFVFIFASVFPCALQLCLFCSCLLSYLISLSSWINRDGTENGEAIR